MHSRGRGGKAHRVPTGYELNAGEVFAGVLPAKGDGSTRTSARSQWSSRSSRHRAHPRGQTHAEIRPGLRLHRSPTVQSEIKLRAAEKLQKFMEGSLRDRVVPDVGPVQKSTASEASAQSCTVVHHAGITNGMNSGSSTPAGGASPRGRGTAIIAPNPSRNTSWRPVDHAPTPLPVRVVHFQSTFDGLLTCWVGGADLLCCCQACVLSAGPAAACPPPPHSIRHHRCCSAV